MTSLCLQCLHSLRFKVRSGFQCHSQPIKREQSTSSPKGCLERLHGCHAAPGRAAAEEPWKSVWSGGDGTFFGPHTKRETNPSLEAAKWSHSSASPLQLDGVVWFEDEGPGGRVALDKAGGASWQCGGEARRRISAGMVGRGQSAGGLEARAF